MIPKVLPKIVYPKLISPYTIHKYPEFIKFINKKSSYPNVNKKVSIKQREIKIGSDSKMMYCLELDEE